MDALVSSAGAVQVGLTVTAFLFGFLTTQVRSFTIHCSRYSKPHMPQTYFYYRDFKNDPSLLKYTVRTPQLHDRDQLTIQYHRLPLSGTTFSSPIFLNQHPTVISRLSELGHQISCSNFAYYLSVTNFGNRTPLGEILLPISTGVIVIMHACTLFLAQVSRKFTSSPKQDNSSNHTEFFHSASVAGNKWHIHRRRIPAPPPLSHEPHYDNRDNDPPLPSV